MIHHKMGVRKNSRTLDIMQKIVSRAAEYAAAGGGYSKELDQVDKAMHFCSQAKAKNGGASTCKIQRQSLSLLTGTISRDNTYSVGARP
jgi:hypothetical protein